METEFEVSRCRALGKGLDELPLQGLESDSDLLSDLTQGLFLQLAFLIESLHKFQRLARIALNLRESLVVLEQGNLPFILFLKQLAHILLLPLYTRQKMPIDAQF